MPEAAPLVANARGFCARRPGVDWQAGHYVVPRVTLGSALTVEQRHTALGSVRVECRFPLGGLALWGNARTFSFEPFFQTYRRAGRGSALVDRLHVLGAVPSAARRCVGPERHNLALESRNLR